MKSTPRIGVALAGGGPLGAVYEIGALCALEEAVAGLDLTACKGYVGVSAGGFVAAGLANGLSPREQCRLFIENHGAQGRRLDPAALMQPDWKGYAQRLAGLPGVLGSIALDAVLGLGSRGRVMDQLGSALPIGVFSNEAVHRQLARVFSARGRTNDFRQLRQRLVLVAVDLDSGQARPFGMPGHDDVPISRAVQASAALPGLFPPVKIKDRYYVDGALKKTLHASVLLEQGLDLLICLNPLVPWDGRAQPHGDEPGAPASACDAPRLVELGLPTVLSQTFRSMIRSRMELGMKGYAHAYPRTDIVLLEPRSSDATIFFHNPFSYAQRRWMVQHAYAETLRWMRAHRHSLADTLARHGLVLDDKVLDDQNRQLIDSRLPPRGRAQKALRRLERTLQQLETQFA